MGGESHHHHQHASHGASYPKLANGPKGKQIHGIYKDRLGQFTDRGQYARQGLMSRIGDKRVSGAPHVELEVYSPPDLQRPLFDQVVKEKFKPTKQYEQFGPSWSTHWFRITLTVPEKLQKEDHLEFHWDANNEGCVYDEHGQPLQGLTGGGERVEWVLKDKYRDGKAHIIYIEMSCNAMFGNPPGGDTIQPPNPNKYFTLQTADIVAIDMEARQLYIDFWIIGDAAKEFPEDSWEEHEALQVCNEIMDTFIAGDGSHESLVAARKVAQKYIGNVNSAKVYDNDNEAIVNAIGNCHIDTCWLWPWAETKRKVLRSWMNQCDLLERYPEHRFVASQAQQWQWLERIYPKAFDRVKAKVKEGTFQPIGGSWVEHDTNLPSGESLVRQFLYGQRYFESRFGARCKTFWLPDTFGYSSQLPQLCRLAGMDYFLTQKLSWNNINNFPHTSFNWVSLDGSQVICHMPPCETYTADAHFGDVHRSVTRHKSLDQDKTSLLPFGKGDGGGGPTWEHIEKLRRCRGMADTTGRLPRVQYAKTVDDFFAKLQKRGEEKPLVTWYGELYFELHRGTYTTQANNKRNNRKAEILMHDIEYFATLASIRDHVQGTKTKYEYPKKDIDRLWEGILLCQFHDCLPGSSIEMCYRDSDDLYAVVFEDGKQLLDNAFHALGFPSGFQARHAKYALNTLPWKRGTIQHTSDEVLTISKPGLGVSEIDLEKIAIPLESTDSSLGYQISRDADLDMFRVGTSNLIVDIVKGQITSIFDKRVQRELIPKGQRANQLVIFDDKPLYWQAWDVEVFHLDSRRELEATSSSWISALGYDGVSITTDTKISDKSSIRTTITINNDSLSNDTPTNSLINVTAEVDWHEEMKFLKVEFPTTLRSQTASYETQYGVIQRPTHYNTSWDMAKFEVCCHKFADLSEANYGVSILNDSKYGFATVGGLMRLSLLRSPKAPDAHADMGRHTIKWAVLPHLGPLGADTVRSAFELNYPVHQRAHPNIEEVRHLLDGAFKLEEEGNWKGLVLDVIKRAEDDEDVAKHSSLADDKGHTGLKARSGKSVVLRVYESLGGKSRGRIVFGKVKIAKVWRTNLLEDDEEELSLHDNAVAIDLRAFEVFTLRAELA